MRQLIVIFFFLNFSNYAYSQGKYFIVTGKVIDSLSGDYITNFSLSLSNNKTGSLNILYKVLKDSTFVSGEIPLIYNTLTISSVGYRTKTISLKKKVGNVELLNIFLTNDIIILSEVDIKSRRNRLSLDSLRFGFRDSTFAGSKMTKDVLELIPGISIIDNQIFYNNLNIKNITVNGKSFFFNDNEMLLSNLPGFSISHIEIIKPDAEQKKYLNEQPQINIVLKEQSNKGYLSKSLAAYGTSNARAGDFFGGVIGNKIQVGVNFDNNNINCKNPLLLDNTYSSGGVNDITNSKISISKSLKGLDFESNYSKSRLNITNQQELTKFDKVEGDMFRSSFFNSSNSNLNKSQMNNQLLYKITSNSLMKLNQEILYTNNQFLNSTNVISDKYADRSDYVIENNTSSIKVDNNVNYNYKDIKNQNKTLDIEVYNSTNKTNNLKASSISNENIQKKLFNHEIKIAANFTYLLKKNSYLIASISENLNYLNHTTIENDSSKFIQLYNSAKLKFGGKLKKIDYSISFENFYYDFRVKVIKQNTESNKVLPVININYSPVFGVKLGASYNKAVTVTTLGQLSQFSLDNDFLNRRDNYDIEPETSEAFEFTFEKIKNSKNLFLNLGYLNRKDVLGTIFVDNADPSVILQNAGIIKTFYLNTRQYIDLTKKITFSSYLNCNISKQSFRLSDNEISTKTTLLEFNFGLKYIYSKRIDVSIISGITKSTKFFGSAEDRYRSALFMNSLKVSCGLIANIKIHLSADFQYNENNAANLPNNLNSIVNFLGQRVFLKDKNFILFFRVHDLFDNRTRNVQEYSINNSVQYSKMNTLGRYFMLGLTYKFNTLKR